MKKKEEIIRKGSWKYQGKAKELMIIKQNWDFYYDEYLEGEPDLNDKGFAYYVIFDSENPLSRSETCLSLEDAINLCKKKIKGKIMWRNDK